MSDHYAVAMEALRGDARRWHEVADTTSVAGKAAESLTLTEDDLSFASVRGSSLLSTYGSLQEKVTRLLQEATTNFNAMGDTLTAVADRYQASEDEASAEFKDLWTIK